MNSAGSWWVGLTKRGTHPIWHWLSTGETVSYDNWADDSNEPQNRIGEDCASLRGYSGWKYADGFCKIVYTANWQNPRSPFICEYH